MDLLSIHFIYRHICPAYLFPCGQMFSLEAKVFEHFSSSFSVQRWKLMIVRRKLFLLPVQDEEEDICIMIIHPNNVKSIWNLSRIVDRWKHSLLFLFLSQPSFSLYSGKTLGTLVDVVQNAFTEPLLFATERRRARYSTVFLEWVQRMYFVCLS